MLDRENAVLVVVDVQSRLLGQIHEAEETVRQITRILRGFQIVEAPVVVTEQYRKGLGATHPAIQRTWLERGAPDSRPDSPRADIHLGTDDPHLVLDGFEMLEKMTFSCAADDATIAHLRGLGRTQIVLTGIEAHVCVLQTALHLLEQGFETYVVADAVSSRKPRNVEIALRRMEQEGVLFTSVEMAVFEMLHVCGTGPFKQWIQTIR